MTKSYLRQKLLSRLSHKVCRLLSSPVLLRTQVYGLRRRLVSGFQIAWAGRRRERFFCSIRSALLTATYYLNAWDWLSRVGSIFAALSIFPQTEKSNTSWKVRLSDWLKLVFACKSGHGFSDFMSLACSRRSGQHRKFPPHARKTSGTQGKWSAAPSPFFFGSHLFALFLRS